MVIASLSHKRIRQSINQSKTLFHFKFRSEVLSRVDVRCKVNFHVVRSALQISMCTLYIFADQVLCRSRYVLRHICLRSFAVYVNLRLLMMPSMKQHRAQETPAVNLNHEFFMKVIELSELQFGMNSYT